MMPLSHLVAPFAVLSWLAAQLWVYLPSISNVTDTAFITKLMVEEIIQVVCWISVWAWLTWQSQGRTRLAEHTLVATGAAFIDAAVLNFAMPWVFFLVGGPWPVDQHNIPRTALITLAALLHLHLTSRQGLNRRLMAYWLAGSVLALALVSTYTWAKNNDRAAQDKLPYSPNIYPSAFVMKPQHTLQEGLEHMWGRSWGEESP